MFSPGSHRTPFVCLRDAATQSWIAFENPVEIIRADTLEQVQPCLQSVDRAVEKSNLFAAGFLSYEAGAALDPAFPIRNAPGFPLVWFGLYREPKPFQLPSADQVSIEGKHMSWVPAIDSLSYSEHITRIKEAIRCGETYQVNYTFRLSANLSENPWGFFCRIAARPAPFSAYIEFENTAICSFSPELFFSLKGNLLRCRPMKGTSCRGRTLDEDEQRIRELQNSAKNRAENVMIVDMMRNDLGRIAQPGTVQVEELFTVERHPTVLQMTSTISARTIAPLSGIFEAMFPCASVTGAPKPKTMHIIDSLESTPRHIYTGSIGFAAPGRKAQFNVAIRTVLADVASRTAEYGVGGGIVWDSLAHEEYDECWTKAQVLTRHEPPFSLLETILFEPESGFFLLDLHLERLAASARYFSIPYDHRSARDYLKKAEANCPPEKSVFRLLVDQSGSISHGVAPVKPCSKPLRIGIAPSPVDSENPFLFHKTTNRRVYEEARAACPHHDDVLLWNERGEITETTIANVILEKDGMFVTPKLDCGLLPGVFRQFLLNQGKITESIIRREHLKDYSSIYRINSVRRWEKCILEG